MQKKEVIKFLIFRSVGNFLILFALYGVIATFGPALYYEASFRISQIRGIKYTVAAESETSPLGELLKKQRNQGGGLASVLIGPREQILRPIDTEFNILIPKIGANAKVFPNIDPSDENAFLPVLREGVAHSRGTVFPGSAGNIYLFAHSEIVMIYQGTRFNYTVTRSAIVDPDDVSFITEAQGGPEQLILQTCWPPGTTWKRLLVFAKRK